MMSMDYRPATVRDRTKEFAAAAERAAKSSGASSIGGGEGGLSSSGIDGADASSSTGATSEFARMSARIGRGIHATSQKLERLAQLAKRSGTFDDPSRDIAELSAVIKQDITALNSARSPSSRRSRRARRRRNKAAITPSPSWTRSSRG